MVWHGWVGMKCLVIVFETVLRNEGSRENKKYENNIVWVVGCCEDVVGWRRLYPLGETKDVPS